LKNEIKPLNTKDLKKTPQNAEESFSFRINGDDKDVKDDQEKKEAYGTRKEHMIEGIAEMSQEDSDSDGDKIGG
jgi:hypothetical protein